MRACAPLSPARGEGFEREESMRRGKHPPRAFFRSFRGVAGSRISTHAAVHCPAAYFGGCAPHLCRCEKGEARRSNPPHPRLFSIGASQRHGWGNPRPSSLVAPAPTSRASCPHTPQKCGDGSSHPCICFVPPLRGGPGWGKNSVPAYAASQLRSHHLVVNEPPSRMACIINRFAARNNAADTSRIDRGSPHARLSAQQGRKTYGVEASSHHNTWEAGLRRLSDLKKVKAFEATSEGPARCAGARPATS
jgi:hypothetical protein